MIAIDASWLRRRRHFAGCRAVGVAMPPLPPGWPAFSAAIQAATPRHAAMPLCRAVGQAATPPRLLLIDRGGPAPPLAMPPLGRRSHWPLIAGALASWGLALGRQRPCCRHTPAGCRRAMVAGWLACQLISSLIFCRLMPLPLRHACRH